MVALEIGNREDEVGSKGRNSALLPSYSLIVTPASFARALQSGWSPPALLDALNRLTDRPLTGAENALLRIWTEASQRVNLSPAWLLETTDPAIIKRLASTRRGRTLIHRTLSPRTVVVDPARLDQLVRRLVEQEGMPPKMPGVNSGQFEARGGKSSSSLIWLTVQVYQQLGQYIALPVRIPQFILDQLTSLVQPADLASAEIAVEQTLTALRLALDGRVPFPAFQAGAEAGLAVEESLRLIGQALAGGQKVRLHYYAASTDTLSWRLVEPYRLEWHHDTPYLVGFCHHAQAERTFRVDRIRAIQAAGDKE